jgi:hypothetical protein
MVEFGFGLELRGVLGDPVGGEQEDRLRLDISARAAAPEQGEAGVEAAREMRSGPTSLDEDQAADALGRAERGGEAGERAGGVADDRRLFEVQASISASRSWPICPTVTCRAARDRCGRCRDGRRG